MTMEICIRVVVGTLGFACCGWLGYMQSLEFWLRRPPQPPVERGEISAMGGMITALRVLMSMPDHGQHSANLHLHVVQMFVRVVTMVMAFL